MDKTGLHVKIPSPEYGGEEFINIKVRIIISAIIVMPI
jgi:hypothetical protein